MGGNGGGQGRWSENDLDRILMYDKLKIKLNKKSSISELFHKVVFRFH